ncbi:CorA family divalent cation transporter [Chachezhania antarctica]|uniref:CorA family divalent cation transporter n=1 Tax=Chachezhania antarctica TaxID=2340860 RepID=UPI000EB34C33|nr:CorA family divalent cation transporter [Chachezhania antarctica]|tara:strand:- start:5027 stop:5983 length:957 start_codon:yes stop_codon:yes gene_type:complete
MIFAYTLQDGRLALQAQGADMADALWIDMFRPTDEQLEQVRALGFDIPSKAEMRGLKPSNRMHLTAGIDYMTVVMPGRDVQGHPTNGPVSFMLGTEQLVTVRHHAVRAFKTFPGVADQTAIGCSDARCLLLGLLGENIGGLADMMERIGDRLDELALWIFDDDRKSDAELEETLKRTGRMSELIGKIRLALLNLDRLLGHLEPILMKHEDAAHLKPMLPSLERDVSALAVHCDYLTGRVGFATEATMGMIDLGQNRAVSVMSAVTSLFIPPTLIASIYGMNFIDMPELQDAWGYEITLLGMVASSVLTYFLMRWQRWL